MGKSVGAAYNTIKSKLFCFIDNAAAILFEDWFQQKTPCLVKHNQTN